MKIFNKAPKLSLLKEVLLLYLQAYLFKMTKTQIINFIVFFSVLSLWGQRYEFGLNLGAGNYIGDVGQEYYFMHNRPGAGVMFKNTSNPWFGVRLNANYHSIYADDLESVSLGRQERRLRAEGTLWDFSAGIEYNFLPRNPFLRPKRYQRFTPYMYSGLGIATFYGDLYKNINPDEDVHLSSYSGSSFFIPMTLGIKYKIGEHLLIGVETTAKYYFTDDLDGTGTYFNPENLDSSTKIQTTNPNSNDWYTFTSFSIIYTFGDLLCYFNIR